MGITQSLEMGNSVASEEQRLCEEHFAFADRGSKGFVDFEDICAWYVPWSGVSPYNRPQHDVTQFIADVRRVRQDVTQFIQLSGAALQYNQHDKLTKEQFVTALKAWRTRPLSGGDLMHINVEGYVESLKQTLQT